MKAKFLIMSLLLVASGAVNAEQTQSVPTNGDLQTKRMEMCAANPEKCEERKIKREQFKAKLEQLRKEDPAAAAKLEERMKQKREMHQMRKDGGCKK